MGVPRYLWPQDHQRKGEPFCDPLRPHVVLYVPADAGPHDHHEPLCGVCEAYLASRRGDTSSDETQ